MNKQILTLLHLLSLATAAETALPASIPPVIVGDETINYARKDTKDTK